MKISQKAKAVAGNDSKPNKFAKELPLAESSALGEMKRRIIDNIRAHPGGYNDEEKSIRFTCFGRDFAIECAKILSEGGSHECSAYIYRSLGMGKEMREEALLQDSWRLLKRLGLIEDLKEYAKKKADLGNHPTAASIFEEIGEYASAREMYHLSGEHHNEFRIAKEHGLDIDADACVADLKERKMFISAAFLLKKAGKEIEYARMLVNECQEQSVVDTRMGGADDDFARIFGAKSGPHSTESEAAGIFEKHGLVEEAATSYLAAYEYEKAAEMYEKAGMIDKARELIMRHVPAGRLDDIRAYIKEGREDALREIAGRIEGEYNPRFDSDYYMEDHSRKTFLPLAIIYEMLGSFDKAIDYYALCGRWWAALHLAKGQGKESLDAVMEKLMRHVSRRRLGHIPDYSLMLSAFGRQDAARELFVKEMIYLNDRISLALKLGLKEEAIKTAIGFGEYEIAQELLADPRNIHKIDYRVEYGEAELISVRFNDRVWDGRKSPIV